VRNAAGFGWVSSAGLAWAQGVGRAGSRCFRAKSAVPELIGTFERIFRAFYQLPQTTVYNDNACMVVLPNIASE